MAPASIEPRTADASRARSSSNRRSTEGSLVTESRRRHWADDGVLETRRASGRRCACQVDAARLEPPTRRSTLTSYDHAAVILRRAFCPHASVVRLHQLLAARDSRGSQSRTSMTDGLRPVQDRICRPSPGGMTSCGVSACAHGQPD